MFRPGPAPGSRHPAGGPFPHAAGHRRAVKVGPTVGATRDIYKNRKPTPPGRSASLSLGLDLPAGVFTARDKNARFQAVSPAV